MAEKSGSELFIVDNSEKDWKVVNYLKEWCDLSTQFDIATGFFEIGSLLSLEGLWQRLNKIRILMGDEVSRRTKAALLAGIDESLSNLDASIEKEKEQNDFLEGVPAIVQAIKSNQIECRIYTKDKFHAKAYITHSKHRVVGSSALVGSSNMTYPGLHQNVELNIQLRREVEQLQEWFERHWGNGEDISEEVLKTITRHTREYSPFEIYFKAMQQLFRFHQQEAGEWEKQDSKIYKILANYQKDGYHNLLDIAEKWGGAFLCDGVGLGKTFIGLMLIERLVVKDKKNVALLVPKSARNAVWEAKIKELMPELMGGFLSFRIFNHTDLSRDKLSFELEQIKNHADVIIVDEAHHFRNRGVKGKESGKKSRYWKMFDLCEGKELYMLTATPVNNELKDFQHMAELFTRGQNDHFKAAPLGIHSLPSHIRKIENALKKITSDKNGIFDSSDILEAQRILSKDDLFQKLVVQRSRSYVKKSIAQEEGKVLFPENCIPEVVEYSVKQTYGNILNMVEEAFHRKNPLFTLSMYYPWSHYIGGEDLDKQNLAMQVGRQKQVVRLIRTSFLKRFESSVEAFKASCETLMKKLAAFYQIHAENDKHRLDRLEKWLIRNKEITGHNPRKQFTLIEDDLESEMIEEDAIEPEFFMNAREEKLSEDEFIIDRILEETLDDLETVSRFLNSLREFKPKQDKKLNALLKLLKKNKIMQEQKIIIFTEFKDTARYIYDQLLEKGYQDICKIDSDTQSQDRENIIKRFSPYYNSSSSAELKKLEMNEIRILISTDVLSEGLNLQDAARLINYDLHWNPVRLMQRIGRIDRRLDPAIEERIIRDHPETKRVRGTTQYYNFLPPEELNELLSLYSKVTNKTLRISKTFGIEGGQLLTAQDDYEMLKNFNAEYEGEESQAEIMHLEYEQLVKDYPELAEKANSFPNKIFSGKQSPEPDSRFVFFCYARPAQDAQGQWSFEAGDSAWYLFNIDTEKITENPYDMLAAVRSSPETKRTSNTSKQTLTEIRKKIEKHIKNTYFKRAQAPIGTKATLKAWMEIN
ncbi:helicase-related protein [Sedimentisphaera salicampi]|uniref:helicase-related protein n=1 Tax=Sedimentisphaera salicampi TaxID=1941349 RepID=UPI000B9AF255|nr:helicase-related protein [Sedimentisphaera salicampi]OXU15101.1 ATP-independent RNA helicase DbpA [Sedimentisphaera salicampi]